MRICDTYQPLRSRFRQRSFQTSVDPVSAKREDYMRPLLHFVVLLFTVVLTGDATANTLDFDRGLRNYRAVVEGSKRLDDLSEVEKQEVVAVARIMRSRDSDDGSEECVKARQHAEAAAAELAHCARRLRNCAESNSFSDDCGSEFRRVRSAHYEYESAVSEVGTHCE